MQLRQYGGTKYGTIGGHRVSFWRWRSALWHFWGSQGPFLLVKVKAFLKATYDLGALKKGLCGPQKCHRELCYLKKRSLWAPRMSQVILSPSRRDFVRTTNVVGHYVPLRKDPCKPQKYHRALCRLENPKKSHKALCALRKGPHVSPKDVFHRSIFRFEEETLWRLKNVIGDYVALRKGTFLCTMLPRGRDPESPKNVIKHYIT